MPATHAIVCGSVLNKTVSCGDERWGLKWDDLAESLRVYALGDVKHGWIIWTTVLGCLLRDVFPDPESALYLTGTTQAKFVQGFSTFVLESLMGTESHPHCSQSSTDKRGAAQLTEISKVQRDLIREATVPGGAAGGDIVPLGLHHL